MGRWMRDADPVLPDPGPRWACGPGTRSRRPRWRRSVVLLVLAGLALARAPAGEAGESPSVEFLPGALEPGTWIEWSETLRVPAPEAASTSAASGATKEPGLVLKANGITACFGGPEGVPDRILDSVLDWSLDDGSGAIDRSATGVQLIGLGSLNARVLRIGQAEVDSALASEWLLAHEAAVFGPRDDRLLEGVLPDLGDTGEYPNLYMEFSRVRSGAVSIGEWIGLSRTVRVTKAEWERKLWINARVHAPDLPGVWDRAFRSRTEQGTCWLQGTVTCRRTAAGGTETHSLLEGRILRAVGAAPSGAAPETRWTEERTAILRVRGERWTPKVVGTPPPCEVGQLVHVGAQGQIGSWGCVSRLPSHRCWVATLVGSWANMHLYVYPSPVEEAHLDRLVGEDLRGHLLALADSSLPPDGAEVVESVGAKPHDGGAATWIPTANGPVRRLLSPFEEERDVPGMGRIASLGVPDGLSPRGQVVLSSDGNLLGVVDQPYDRGEYRHRAFLTPVLLRCSMAAGTIIPSAAADARISRLVGWDGPSGWDPGVGEHLFSLDKALSTLVTHAALVELEQVVVDHPQSDGALSLLIRARAMRGEYAGAVEADDRRRKQWPANRIASVFSAWRLLRDEVVLSKGNDHCELYARLALSGAPSDPALQDAVLAALCRCEAYETATDLVVQLGLSRPGSIGDLRTVHAYLVREGDAARAARVEALVRAASGPR